MWLVLSQDIFCITLLVTDVTEYWEWSQSQASRLPTWFRKYVLALSLPEIGSVNESAMHWSDDAAACCDNLNPFRPNQCNDTPWYTVYIFICIGGQSMWQHSKDTLEGYRATMKMSGQFQGQGQSIANLIRWTFCVYDPIWHSLYLHLQWTAKETLYCYQCWICRAKSKSVYETLNRNPIGPGNKPWRGTTPCYMHMSDQL